MTAPDFKLIRELLKFGAQANTLTMADQLLKVMALCEVQRKALKEIDSWRGWTLGDRTGNEPESTQDFDRGTRMAFYRCAERAKEALAASAEPESGNGLVQVPQLWFCDALQRA